MKQNLPFRPKLRSIGSKNSIVTVKYIVTSQQADCGYVWIIKKQRVLYWLLAGYWRKNYIGFLIFTLHKKWSFPLRISSVNAQFLANLVTFTKDILYGKLPILCREI